MSAAPVRATEPHAERRLTLAALLEKTQGVIECRVSGRCMLPALPPGCRVRIRPERGAAAGVGDIIAVAVRDQIISHRVVRADDGRGHLLTRGDAALLVDPPVARSWILGRITEAWIDGRWRPPGAAPPHGPRALARALAYSAVAVWMPLSVRIADTVAHLLVRLGRRPGSGRPSSLDRVA